MRAKAVLLWLVAMSPTELARLAEPGLRAIRGDAISAHIRFLADDALEGRAPGTPGHAVAARYLATQLQSAGVEPAGEGSSWFQRVPLVAVRADPSRCGLTIMQRGSSSTLADGREIIVFPSPTRPDAEVSGPLVFAGHGVVAPIYGYDDTPANVRGKIVVVLGRAPRSDREDFFPSAPSAHFGNWQQKMSRLAERGALAVLSVPPPESLHSYPWAERARDRDAFGELAWADDGGSGGGLSIPRVELSPAAFDELLRRAGRKETTADLLIRAREGRLRPFDLGLTATLRTAAAVRRLVSENVVGVLRGSDPARSGEYVAVTAHLDHLGVGPAVDGDEIYNGALDDAAGVASLIEIAKGFAALPRRPARSILFVGTTAEEWGLVGADFFVRHPTVPRDAIVADVNSDDLFGHWRPFEVHAVGGEHSSLGANARAAAQALGLAFGPDPDPAQAYFVRGDHYSFVEAGIPAVQPGISYKDSNGSETANRAVADRWLERNYHQPSDEWDAGLDYENMAVEVRYYFLVALSAALEPARPSWNAGDVFAKLFGTAKAQ